MLRFRSSVTVALLSLAACGRKTESAAHESTSLTLTASDVVEARVMPITDAVSMSGPLEPMQTVPLKAQINAIAHAVRADRGSRVHRGDTLVILEANGLHGLAAGAKAAVAAADASLALATQRFEAAKRMHASGGMSDYDLKSADASRQLAEAQAAAARAQMATASENESRAAVLSPIDGIVSDRNVQPGEAVKDGGLLLTVVDTRTLELRAQVGVDDAMRVRPDLPVIFTLDAARGETFRGRVARVDPRADPATRQVGVTAELANHDGRIVAGQFAHGRVLTGSAAPMVAVPMSAVMDSAGQARVFVVSDGKLHTRAITLGPRDEDQGLVGVRTGLKAGERVLASPVVGAADGLLVQMADTTSARAVNGNGAATKEKAP